MSFIKKYKSRLYHESRQKQLGGGCRTSGGKSAETA